MLAIGHWVTGEARVGGYPTPKLDVRGAVIHDNKILLVKEASSGRWTLPGGWADVNATPAENVEREVFEESGYTVRAKKIINLVDRNRSGYPPHPEYIYKLHFLCELIGGEPQVRPSTSARFAGSSHRCGQPMACTRQASLVLPDEDRYRD